MEKCSECGKKLGILKGYRHPALGKNYHLCSPCFDTVNNSIEKYREFISPYIKFFKNKTSNNNQFNIKGISEKFADNNRIYDRISAGKGI